MTISIGKFNCELPRIDEDLLPDGYAALAANCDTSTGNLRSLRAPGRVTPLSITNCQSLYRYRLGEDELWVASDKLCHYAKSPISGDQYERVYFSGEAGLRFFANDNISPTFNPAADYYLVGIPRATAYPTIGSSGGSTGYRAYVYSYINRYGDEGPPSPIGSISNYASGRVTIEGVQDAPIQRSIDRVRVYRTNSGTAGSGEFQMVLDAFFFRDDTVYNLGEYVIYGGSIYECTTHHPVGAWNAAHFTSGEAVSDADLLTIFPKVNFDPPPAGMMNLIGLANGSMAGFVGNTIYFSEPFYPHAWPPEYALPLQTEIVGMANEKNSITVAGKGFPYIIYGSHPLSMQRTMGSEMLPLYGPRAICTGNSGVFFVTKQGLIYCDGVAFVNITGSLMRSEDWEAYSYENLFIYWYEKKLFAFDTVNETGFYIDFSGQSQEFVQISLFIQAGYIDADGQFYFVGIDTNIIDESAPPATLPLAIFKWAGATSDHIQYTYLSKIFVYDTPVNMAAALVMMDGIFYKDTTKDARNAIIFENQALMAAGLHGSIGDGHAIGGPYPIAGDELKTLRSLRLSNYVQFKLYVDGVLRKSKVLSKSTNRFRLPGQYLGQRFQFEFVGYLPVRRVVISTSMEEII